MTQLRGKPCHSRQIKMAQVEYLLYNSSVADNQGGLRQGMPEVTPVDRTALAVGSRSPPRRLRMERSTRSVAGIPGLQAGEDVKNNSPRNTAALSLPSLVIARRRVLEQGAAVLTAMALGVSLTGCAQNDALDRRQLILIDEDEVERMSDITERQIRQQFGRSRNPARQREIERMLDRMATVEGAPRTRRGLRAEVLNDRNVNAFALPNGYSGYHDGLFAFAREDKDEIASVMGHEMGHIAGRHAQERLSQELAMSIGVAIIGTTIAGRSWSPAIGAALGLGRAMGGAAFSREHEREADRLGLVYAARAGYDARKAPNFFARKERELGDDPMTFLSTHPSHGERQQRMVELLERDQDIVQAMARQRR